jgi:hypothetical protein
MMGLGWSKGVNGWADEYIATLPADAACKTQGSGLSQTLQHRTDGQISKADFEQNLNDITESCAGYVKSNRFASSRASALTVCRGKVNSHFKCSISEQQNNAYLQDQFIQDQVGKTKIWPYVAAFLFVGVIFYLLTSK